MGDQHRNLKRLPREYYQGDAWVHWSLTIGRRATGWLSPVFLFRFREILTHTCFRHKVACTVYCMMPDHVHMLWNGLTGDSNQLKAIEFFRRRSNESLRSIGFEWQRQGFDRVLRDNELEQSELVGISDYIARNPERAGLVPQDGFHQYRYSGCLLPGYPELKLFEPESWDRIFRALHYLKRTQVFHSNEGGT